MYCHVRLELAIDFCIRCQQFDKYRKSIDVPIQGCFVVEKMHGNQVSLTAKDDRKIHN